jgi:hypothetical protein
MMQRGWNAGNWDLLMKKKWSKKAVKKNNWSWLGVQRKNYCKFQLRRKKSEYQSLESLTMTITPRWRRIQS